MAHNPERRLDVRVSDQDWRHLHHNQFSLQVAQSVECQGRNHLALFNLIWRTGSISPRTTISWKPVYGINWTLRKIVGNQPIRGLGEWQQCDLGQVFDIDQTGAFIPSKSPPHQGFMKIGVNNFNARGTDQLQIVIGVQNTEGRFQPIFVDPEDIEIGGSASFKPLQQVEWWYERRMAITNVSSYRPASYEAADFSQPDPTTNTFFKESSYDAETEMWNTRAV